MSQQMFKNGSITNKSAQRYEFDIENVDLSIVNGIRRVILSDIPVLGFRGEEDPTVTILKNNGPLHNEFMTHRIGLIPLHFSEEATEGFTENEYVFECDVMNKEYAIQNITTHHITGTRNNISLTDKELKQIFPINSITDSPIVITRLRQGEELHFTANVIKSTAAEHAGFSPVSLCSFYYNEDPLKIKEVTGILEKERTYLKNNFGDPTSIHFMIESECQLSPKYLVAKAFEILIQKINQLSEKMSIEPHETMKNTFDVKIINETDTIGNIIQSLLFNKYIRDGNKVLNNKYSVSYVGYYAPHPLDKLIVVRMTLQSEDISQDINEFGVILNDSLRFIEQQLKQIYEAWLRFE
jgi:DNA-directed RNA polymerase alpha subunit